jgi:hypothetical protein
MAAMSERPESEPVAYAAGALRAAGIPIDDPLDHAEVLADVDAWMAVSEPERRRDRFEHGVADLVHDSARDEFVLPGERGDRLSDPRDVSEEE